MHSTIKNIFLAIGLMLASLSAVAQSYPVLKFQKFYGFKGDDRATCIEKGLDNSLFVGGFTQEETENGCSNIWILKLDTLGNVLWDQSFGGSGCDEIRDLISTPDSGVIFVGITNSFIEHPEKGEEQFQGDFFIGKLNSDGSIGWLKTYGGIDIDQAYAVARSGNDFVVAGASSSTNFDVNTELGMANLWCVKVGPTGLKKNAWSYGGSKHDWAYSIAACKNGDFVLAGYTSSEDIDGTTRRTNGDGWILRIDRYGSVKWQKIFSGKFEDYFTRVIEDRDGRILVVGIFETEEKGKQFWVLKLTADGAKIYERIFGDGQDEVSTGIVNCSDGSYLMCGYSRYTSLASKYIKGGEDFWLQKLDGKTGTIWAVTYGGRDDERAFDVIEYSPGIYYAVGEKLNNFGEAIPSMKKDFWLVKVQEEQCKNIKIDIYLSLKDYTAYINRSFKLKAVVEKGDSFIWDFGDGTNSTEKEPIHTYKQPGVYQIKLTVLLNENCAQTYALPNFIMVW